MSEQHPPRLRLYLIESITLAELAHLAWEHFHGGIRSHHFLNSTDMPAISNAWGALLLPALAWFLSAFIQKRIVLISGTNDSPQKLPLSVIAGFVGSLLVGILLSISFTSGHETITEYLFMGVLLLALLLPVYRAECVLGFVLGMTFTFGAILPTVVASVIAAFSALVHLCVRPFFIGSWCRLWRK